MIRRIAVTALLLLSVTACSTAESGRSRGTPAPSSTPDWIQEQIKGQERDLLGPVASGTGERTLPPFSPTAVAYTVFAQCEGKGSVYVATEAAERGQKVRCGVPTSGLVYSGTDEAQSVTITPSDEVKEWTIAILDGDHNA